MSKEGGEVEVPEQRRKSARILALEEEKKEKQKRNSCATIANYTNNLSKAKASLSPNNIGSFHYHQLVQHGPVFSSSSPTIPPPPPCLKHGRKQKRLEDLDLSSLAHSQSQQARCMQVLAQMLFNALRSDPHKIESQFSLIRGHPAKRSPIISEIKGPRTRLGRPDVIKIGASQLGSRDYENSNLPKRGRPPIYRPWSSFAGESESVVSSVYNAPKILVENEEKGNYGYKASLLCFVKDLGPTTKKVAATKLINCLPKPPAPSQTPLILPRQRVTTEPLVLPSPSFSQRMNIASHNACNQNNTFLNNPLLNLQSSSQGNSLISPSGIQIPEPVDSGISQTKNNLMFPLKEPSQGHDHALGKRPILMGDITSTNFNLFCNFSAGNKTYPTDQNVSTFSIRQNVDLQHRKKTNNQNSKFWLASHLRVIPVYDPNTGRRLLRTVDMIAEANKLQRSGKEKLKMVDHDHEMFGNYWQSILKGKQQVVDDHDHDHDEQLSSTNWQSRVRDVVHRSNNNYNLKPISCDDRFMEAFGNWISSLQMVLSNNNSDNQSHNYPLFPRASSSSSSSSAQLGILPLYNETSCIVHDRAGASSTEYHDHQRRDISTQELLSLMKDARQPDLALQL